MIFIWNFVLIERRHITWYSSQQSFSWKFLVILKHEAAMLERAKSCSSKVLIFLVEGIMDDTNLGNSIDSQSYEYRDCRQIPFHKVTCSVKRINPDHSVLSTKRFERVGISLTRVEVSNICEESSSLVMALIEKLILNKVSWDIFRLYTCLILRN